MTALGKMKQDCRSGNIKKQKTLQNERHARPTIFPVSSETLGSTKQVECGQQALVLRMLRALSATQEPAILFDHIVAAIAEQFASQSAYLCLHRADENTLYLQAFYVSRGTDADAGPTPPTGATRTTKARFLWQALLRTRRPILVPNPASDPRVPFRDFLLTAGLSHLLLVPLVSGTEVLGLIGIMVPGVNIEPEKINLAQVLAQQAALAVKFARMADHARQCAVLEERSRMARDLHDTIAQGFTGVLMQMDLAESVLFRSNRKALQHIVRARGLARDGLVETRRSVFALHPLLLTKHCLAKALQQLAAQLTSDTKLRTEFCFQGAAPVLAPEMEAELLHIGQEALTNIVKHSHSSKIRIEFAADAYYLRLSIQDDGTGFDPSSSTTQSFGLMGMEERARHIGGRFLIDSQPGSGTRVHVTIPLKTRSAAVAKSA